MWIERLAIIASLAVVLTPFLVYPILKIIERSDRRMLERWENPLDVTPKNVDAKSKQLVDYRRLN